MRSGRRQLPWLDSWGSAASLGLLVIAFALRDFGLTTASLVTFVIATALALFAWVAHLRRYRAIHDTPTSRIDSAAQGYVEFEGFAMRLKDQLTSSGLTGTPCLWYRSHAWLRQSSHSKRGFEEKESDQAFLLIDAQGGGQCLVEPAGAEVFVLRKTHWFNPPTGDSDKADEFIEWLLLPGDSIHVLGEFVSADGDRVRKPRFGQPFMIGSIPVAWLAKRQLAMALLNLIVFFVGLWAVSAILGW